MLGMKTQNKKLSIALISLAGLIIVATFVGFLIFQTAAAKTKPARLWVAIGIEALEEELQRPNISDEARKRLESKLWGLYAAATQEARGRKQLTDMPTEVETYRQEKATRMALKSTPHIEGKPLTGIIEDPSVDLPRTEYRILNAWQETINGRYVLVFAGYLTRDPTQGVLYIVRQVPPDSKGPDSGIYLTPQKNGGVRITDARGFRLVLQAEDGAQFYFDVPADAFIDSLDATAVPATPAGRSATSTPAPPYPGP
jgi:hypothetical protein